MAPIEIVEMFLAFDLKDLKAEGDALELYFQSPFQNDPGPILSLVQSALMHLEETEYRDLKNRAIKKLIEMKSAMPSFNSLKEGAKKGGFNKELELCKTMLLHLDEKHSFFRDVISDKSSFTKIFEDLTNCCSLTEFSSFIPSGYIIARAGNYGILSEEIYAIKARQIISFLTEAMNIAKKNRSIDFKDLFYGFFLFSAVERRIIAEEAKTPDAHYFGELRFEQTSSTEPLWTSLSLYSEEYANKIKRLVGSIIDRDIKNLYYSIEKENLSFSFIPDEEVKGRYKVFIHFGISDRGDPIQLSVLFNILCTPSGEDRSTDFMPLHVMIQHTTRDELIKLMPYIAIQFEKILQMKNDEPSFMREMATFQYLMAHACPFMRGSAAVCEWFEVAVFATHGFLLRYNPEKCVNLEALTSSLPDFIAAYEAGLFFDRRPLVES